MIWTPGNHELWTPQQDPVQLRGEHRYRHLVELCRSLGVATPEDPYPVWRGPGGPVTIAPLFLLYDYTFRPAGLHHQGGGARAGVRRRRGVHRRVPAAPRPVPEPRGLVRRPHRRDRAPARRARPERCPRCWSTTSRWSATPRWSCGTRSSRSGAAPSRTADWHLRFNAAAVVYGHLHIPRTTWYDGVRFEEVSLGYPREWQAAWHGDPGRLRQILPAEERR